MPEKTAAALVAKAETCRRLAANTCDPLLAAILLRLAEAYEAKAAELLGKR